MYFDVKSGILNFPIRVYPSNCKKFHEVRVLAVVTTPFGLKLTPDTLDFGTVNTTETVVRSVMLANHSRTKMEYGFLKLPEVIMCITSTKENNNHKKNGEQHSNRFNNFLESFRTSKCIWHYIFWRANSSALALQPQCQ